MCRQGPQLRAGGGHNRSELKYRCCSNPHQFYVGNRIAMAWRSSTSPAGGGGAPPGALVIAAAVTAGLVAGAGGLMAVLWFRERSGKAAAGVLFGVLSIW